MALAGRPDPARKAACGRLFRMRTGAEKKQYLETQDNSGKQIWTRGRSFARYHEQFRITSGCSSDSELAPRVPKAQLHSRNQNKHDVQISAIQCDDGRRDKPPLECIEQVPTSTPSTRYVNCAKAWNRAYRPSALRTPQKNLPQLRPAL